MIVALPGLRLEHYQTGIAREHGFLTFPAFLDNHFIEKKQRADLIYLKRMLRRFGLGAIAFAVSPDYEYDEMLKLKNKYPDINWIFPLHSRNEDFSSFEWVGFPHRKEWRDYDLGAFFKLTEDKKRWYLGFWDESNPQILLNFHGLDTTIPSYYGTKLGMIWRSWGITESALELLEAREIYRLNVINLKCELLKIFKNSRFPSLTSYFKEEITEVV